MEGPVDGGDPTRWTDPDEAAELLQRLDDLQRRRLELLGPGSDPGAGFEPSGVALPGDRFDGVDAFVETESELRIIGSEIDEVMQRLADIER